MPHSPGPWAWLQLGGHWHLCRVDARRSVVISTVEERRYWDGDSPSVIVLAVRNAEGMLVPLTPDHPDARLIQASPDLLDVALAYEQWEGELILDDAAWRDGLPRLTQRLYDRMIEIQAMRNAAKAKALGK